MTIGSEAEFEVRLDLLLLEVLMTSKHEFFVN
jgi:hypothetical protein